MLAAAKGYADLVRDLLKHGADPDSHNSDWATALMRAADKGNLEIVQILLRAGSDPNIVCAGAEGIQFMLHFSIRQDKVDKMREVLRQSGDSSFSGWLDIIGKNAVLEAASQSHVEAVKALLSAGAQPVFPSAVSEPKAFAELLTSVYKTIAKGKTQDNAVFFPLTQSYKTPPICGGCGTEIELQKAKTEPVSMQTLYATASRTSTVQIPLCEACVRKRCRFRIVDSQIAGIDRRFADAFINLQTFYPGRLPIRTPELLMQRFERVGEFAKAEDALFAMFDAEQDSKAAVDLGVAFYERLLAQSDEKLNAGNLPRAEVEEGLKELRNRREHSRTPELLMQRYERTGEFGKAEDTLFAWLDAEPDDHAAVSLGIAFYERLLAQSDAKLNAGNLPRAEVEQGLRELRNRSVHGMN